MSSYKTLYELEMKENLSSNWEKIIASEKKGEDGMKAFEQVSKEMFSKVGKNMDGLHEKMSKSTSGIHEGFLKLSQSLPGLGRVADYVTNPWVIAGAVVGEAGKKAVEESAKFEHAFKPIRNMNLEKPREELDLYKAAIRETAIESGTDLESMSKAFFDYQSLTGKYGPEAVAAMKTIGKFATSTDQDVVAATDAMAKSMAAYGLTSKDTEGILKSNFATVQQGLSTYEELSKVQAEWAADASMVGKGMAGFDQGNKLFDMFSAITKNVDMAGVQTKMAFQSLSDGRVTENIKKYLGVNMYDALGGKRDVTSIITDIAKKFKELGSDQAIDPLIAKIRGTDGLRQLLAFTKTNADALLGSFKRFDEVKGSLNVGTLEANNMNDALKQHEELLNKLNANWSKLGDRIMPTVNDGLKQINDLMDMAGKDRPGFLHWIMSGFQDNPYAKQANNFGVLQNLYEPMEAAAPTEGSGKKTASKPKGKTLEDMERTISELGEALRHQVVGSPEYYRTKRELDKAEVMEGKWKDRKSKNENEALNGVTVGGKGVRNVNVNITNLVGKLESHSAKGDLADVEKVVVSALVGMVRDAEIALATD